MKKSQKETRKGEDAVGLRFSFFRVRMRAFSLRSRLIRPSDFFRSRRKVVLRGEGNAWAPVSGVFDKLREVGVLSYLSYTLFKYFVDDCVDLRS